MAIATTLPVSRVVNVAVEMSPTAAALRNFGSCLILGDSDIIDTDERIRLYSSISDIATDFGISSREYLAAQAFFSQSPQPTQVYIGRWAKSATAGRLRGRTLSSAEQDISLFTAITTGTLSLTIDGASKSMASIDLSAETNLNGVASDLVRARSFRVLRLDRRAFCNHVCHDRHFVHRGHDRHRDSVFPDGLCGFCHLCCGRGGRVSGFRNHRAS